MVGCAKRAAGKAALVGAMVVGLGLAGCGSKDAAAGPAKDAPASASAPATAAGTAAAPANGKYLEQSFTEATLPAPPEGNDCPPDQTLTGKSVGKLYLQVVKNWAEIPFASAPGKKLTYTATIETEQGNVTLQLLHEMAPNHVRNFVALARAGYYDGLVFERTIHETVEGSDQERKVIEAGCPRGTGDVGQGSIGYWLKPEMTDDMKHEEGVVGSCHGEDGDGGACRFYINLSKAPYMDGQYTVFARVTQGLDVATKILSLPVRTDSEYPEGDRPEKPVVIKHVTIHVSPGETVVVK